MPDDGSHGADANPPGNDEDRGRPVTIVASAAVALTTIVVAARFYSKKITRAYFGWDDGFILVGYLACTGLCGVGIATVQLAGLGRHREDIYLHDYDRFHRWSPMLVAFEVLYFTAVALPRMSMLCLYLRVFGWSGRMRLTTQVLLVIAAISWLAFVVTSLFQCRPIEIDWTPAEVREGCVNLEAYFDAQTIPGILLDFAIMGLPLKTIWGLKLPLAKRVALLGVFLVASMGVIASIVRVSIFFTSSGVHLEPSDARDENDRLDNPKLRDFDDWMWTGVDLTVWTMVEASCYVTANCLPHTRSLMSHYVHPRIKAMFYRTVETASIKLASHRRASVGAAGERAPPGLPRHRDIMTAPKNVQEALEASGAACETQRVDQAVVPMGLAAAVQNRESNGGQHSHEIAVGRPRTWGGRDPSRIQVTTELSWQSESV